MNRRIYNPKTVFDSLQYGFSQGVGVRGGTHVFLSGQVGVDAAERVVGTGLAAQIEQVMRNISAVVHEAGGTVADIVVLRIYLVAAERENQRPIADALRRWFPVDPPATSWIIVAGLSEPDWLIEIEAQAVVDRTPETPREAGQRFSI